MAIGDALLGAPTDLPVIPPVGPAPGFPAMDPAALVAQLQQYQSAFAGMPNPALQPALSRFAFNLLQPVKPGDSPGGVLGRSAIDAMDYYTARQQMERNQLFQGMQAGIQQRSSDVQAATAGENIATSQQQRGERAARGPLEVGQLQQAYQKAKADLDLIRQEEAAGVRSPDFLQRKANAEVALREALARMYDAHSKLYNKSADAAGAKGGKQTLNVKTIENTDGTTSLVSTIVVNGEPYQQVFTPPRFTDIRAATDFARKQVDKETPSAWNPFGGKAPYQGTAEEEVARRVKGLMEPTLITVNPRGQRITPEQFDALGGAQATTPGATPPASTSPADFPRESKEQRVAAEQRAVGIIADELKTARANKAPQEEIDALEKELVNAKKTGAVANRYPTTPPPTAGGPTRFERGPDGQIVPVGAKPKPAATPGTQVAGAGTAPQLAPQVEGVGQQFEKARANLQRAQAVLMRYGVREQRSDPQGYRNALAEVARQRADVALLQQGYEQLVAPGLPKATSSRM